MADFHLFLGEKGGIGKTFFASVLARYFQARFKGICCIDTEKNGTGLASFSQLEAHCVRENTAQQTVQTLFEKLASLDAQDLTFVIDTPSEIFEDLIEQNTQTDLNGVLKAAGCTLTLHTVVTGGFPANASLRSLKTVSEAFPETPLAIWCNPFFGNIKYQAQDPQNPGQLQTFERWLVDHGFVAETQLRGLVQVPYFRNREDGNLYDALITRMLGHGLTFEEAIYDETRFFVHQRWCLKFARNIFFRAIHAGLFPDQPVPEVLLQKTPAPGEATTEVEEGEVV